MIIVKLIGGLGNQMFQYAFGQELSNKYGEDVVYDLDFYSNNKERKVAITNLCVDEIADWRSTSISNLEIFKIRTFERIYHVEQKVLITAKKNERIGSSIYNRYSKRGLYFNFDPFYYPFCTCNAVNKVIYGYFQSPDYFNGVKDKIRSQFTPKYECTQEENHWINRVGSTESVAVHIRLGDYEKRKNKKYSTYGREYFSNGMKYILSHIPSAKFFVFTNDINRVKEYFGFSDVEYVIGMKDYQDLRIMSHCKHFIISNSSFSWWGAYLSNNDNKIIMMPEKWTVLQKETIGVYYSGVTLGESYKVL